MNRDRKRRNSFLCFNIEAFIKIFVAIRNSIYQRELLLLMINNP